MLHLTFKIADATKLLQINATQRVNFVENAQKHTSQWHYNMENRFYEMEFRERGREREGE